MNSPQPLPAKRKTGRPSKRTARVAAVLCAYVAKGMPHVHACAAAGISRSLFWEWRAEDSTFDAAIEQAVAKGVARRLARIERAAKQDWRAAAWLLEHCQPQHFAVSRQLLEVSGPDGAPLAGVVAIMLPPKQDSTPPAVTVPALAERNDGNGG